MSEEKIDWSLIPDHPEKSDTKETDVRFASFSRSENPAVMREEMQAAYEFARKLQRERDEISVRFDDLVKVYEVSESLRKSAWIEGEESRKQVEQLKQYSLKLDDWNDKLQAEVERLKAALEQAEAMVGCYKADKARLDWLIDCGSNEFFEALSEYSAQAREAIDAAMKGPQP